MSSIERYIIAEVLKPLLAVLLILASLFACFSGARYLAEAVTETLGVYFMFELIFLKTFIALEVLTPFALYVSIIIGLGRLHRNQEIIAMRAAGLSNWHVVRAIILVSIPVALLVAALSTVGRPWAYDRSYYLDARADADLNTDRFQEGRFYGNEDSGRVIYISKKDKQSGEMQGVFHYVRNQRVSELTLARSAIQDEIDPDEPVKLKLFDGYIYRLNHSLFDDETVKYERLVKVLEDPEKTVGYKRKAATTGLLITSDIPSDIAELQWRLSRPLTTLLLALIAIPLSRNSPRQGKNEKAFAAALVFAVYYNLGGVAKTWVEQGVVERIPGIWWLHALMLAVVIITLWPDLKPVRTR